MIVFNLATAIYLTLFAPIFNLLMLYILYIIFPVRSGKRHSYIDEY